MSKYNVGGDKAVMANEIIAAVDAGEDIADAGYNLGVCVGHEQVAALLRSRAGQAYSEGDDLRAETLRHAAREMGVIAKSLRKEYDERYVPLRDSASEKLKAIDEELAESRREIH